MEQQGARTVSNTQISESVANLRHNNPRIRAGNAFFLGEHRIRQAVDELLLALDDDDVMVVGAASRALGEIRDKIALAKLLSVLNRLENPSGIHKAARYAYGVSFGKIMYEQLPEESPADSSDDTEKVPTRIVENVATGLDVQIQQLGARVHYEVMSALAKLGDERAVSAIASLLYCPPESPSPAFRQDAATALTELTETLPDTEAALPALEAVEDRLHSAAKERWDRGTALETAWRQANSEVLRALRAVKRKERRIRRVLNKSILGKILHRLGIRKAKEDKS